MNPLLQTELQIIQSLQSLGDWLIPFMRFFTFLGEEEFYLLVMPLLYWVFDRQLGIRVGIMLTVSASFNDLLKLIFHTPRPFWLTLDVRTIEFETSFGIPSGHAQNAVAVWGAFAAQLKKGWGRVVALLLMFLIGLSRLFLGVHFVRDVLIGWLIGALILLLYLRMEKPLWGWFSQQRFRCQSLALLGISLALFALGYLAKILLQTWQMPAIWLQNVASVLPPDQVFSPLSISGLLTSSGAFWGLTTGALWIERGGGFSRPKNVLQGGLRFLIGLIGVVILWFGLGAVFPRGESILPYLLRFLRYGLIGGWISALAPWLFLKLKLAERVD